MNFTMKIVLFGIIVVTNVIAFGLKMDTKSYKIDKKLRWTVDYSNGLPDELMTLPFHPVGKDDPKHSQLSDQMWMLGLKFSRGEIISVKDKRFFSALLELYLKSWNSNSISQPDIIMKGKIIFRNATQAVLAESNIEKRNIGSEEEVTLLQKYTWQLYDVKDLQELFSKHGKVLIFDFELSYLVPFSTIM